MTHTQAVSRGFFSGYFTKESIAFLTASAIIIVITALVAALANAASDAQRPTILSVTPANDAQDISTDGKITILFSEVMDAKSINTNSITVKQRSTPDAGAYRSLALDGVVTYSGNTATFTPNEPFAPNQRYGNVITVTVTDSVKDLTGNTLSRAYVWSFTTGEDKFNTGNSTSQHDQSAIPLSGIATPPSVTPPPTTPAGDVSSSSAYPWGWIIAGGAFLLLLVLATIVALTRGTSREERKSTVRTVASPKGFGDTRPVMDLEGIGPEYNRELRAMGIEDTAQLWNADPVTVARKTGAPVSLVRSWQRMAELASVKDIGPQYAELLERSGVHSINQLKNYKPNALLKLVRKKQDSLDVNIQGNTPGPAIVEHWIAAARNHGSSGVKRHAV